MKNCAIFWMLVLCTMKIEKTKNCAVYDEGTLSKSAAWKWFARQRSGNFNVKDDSRSSRPISEKPDVILEKDQQDRQSRN